MRSTALSGLTQRTATRISLFLVLNLADYVLTVAMVSSGMGTEGNPLLDGPLLRVWLVKMLVSVLVALWLADRVVVVRAINAGLGVAIAWNLFWVFAL